MFNFGNITDYEFELLAKDIIQKKLSIELRTYAKGPDGGIDIRGFIGNEIIIQAKHYYKSSFSKLRTVLTEELNKIKKLNPKRYIVVTSFSLTPNNETEIYDMFKDFMKDKQDVIDSNFLNTYLEDEKNIDILKIHNKLWLTSTNVLNIIFNKEMDFDSESFMADYEVKAKLFECSKVYYDALNILEKNNILMLEGSPGVGKSTLSKLLVSHFVTKGYKFKYVSNNSISEIKKDITPLDKEIILMDNFLGQRIADISFNFFQTFKTLIEFISSHKNKKIIVNTRSIVLNEALSTNQVFKDTLEFNNISRCEINMDNLSYLEKSKILYNHIYFYEVPPMHIDALMQDRHYWDIVKHKNFNPRIIEYVTRKVKLNGIRSCDYFSYIIKTLDNPKDVWKDEFQSLSKYDRLFIFTLYTLISFESYGSEFVDSTILKECLENRLKLEPDIDSTINYFETIAAKLAGGLIRINISNSKSTVGFINPSVEDYIYDYLRNLNNEIQKIASSSIYLEQFLRLNMLSASVIKDVLVEKIKSESFFNLKKYTNLKQNYHFLRFVYDYDCMFANITQNVYQLFNTITAFSNERENNAKLVMDFFLDKEKFIYFNLRNLLNNYLFVIHIFEYLDFNQITIFLPFYENIVNLNYESTMAEGIALMISWEIQLDIIHNNNGRLSEGMLEMKNLLGDIEDLEQEEFEQKCGICEKCFIERYLMPLADERKKELSFSRIVEYLNINMQTIIEEISFRDVLISHSFDNDILNESPVLQLGDEYESVVNLFEGGDFQNECVKKSL